MYIYSRAREQKKTFGKQKTTDRKKTQHSRNRNKRKNYGSVEMPRPRLTRGSSIADIFGPPSPKAELKSKAVQHISNTITPPLKIKIEIQETKQDAKISKETKELKELKQLNTINEGASYYTNPINISSPDINAVQKSFKSRSRVNTMQRDNTTTMASHVRTRNQVVLEDCRPNYNRHLPSSQRHTFHGHIIACGAPKSLIYFLSRLRSKSLKRMRKIVVLHTDTSEKQWRLLSAFPKTYMVSGKYFQKRRESGASRMWKAL